MPSVCQPYSAAGNEKDVGDGGTSATRTKCLKLVARLFTSSELEHAVQQTTL